MFGIRVLNEKHAMEQYFGENERVYASKSYT